MKRNKTARRWLRKRTRAVKGGMSKLIALTGEASSRRISEQRPLQAQSPGNESGILRQDAGAFRLPNALAEAGEHEHRDRMPGGFVFLVTGLAVVFIAIIAWFAAQMPAR